MRTWGRTLALGAAVLGLAAGAPLAAAGAETSTLRVFAAASLADAFTALARDFEGTHPGVRVQLNLAGSQQLAVQIEQGARADVFASADERWMRYLEERSLVAGGATLFARNRLVVIVPRINPARIQKLQDLARHGVKLVLGAEAVPVGKYSREALQKLARLDGFEPDFARRALTNVVSEEENVRSVVGKVQLGEADAGMVYGSDVTAAVSRYVTVLDLPDSANVVAKYPIAVVIGAAQSPRARSFIELVLSPAGQATLERHGLIPAAAKP